MVGEDPKSNDKKVEDRKDTEGNDGNDVSDLLERIRQMEERNKQLEWENGVFRKVLRTKSIDIAEILERNKELEYRVQMNSTNSSKPPSSDGYGKPKPKSLRVKTGRRPGGQTGHKGHSMDLPHSPDEVIVHPPKGCENCPKLSECISNGALSCAERKHVVDAMMITKVTEHRTLSVDICPEGHACKKDTGTFPENVSARIQYGEDLVRTSGLLSTYGAMSISRISMMLKGMFDITISEGTVHQMVSRCASKVKPTLDEIRRRITNSDVANFDETGIRVGGKLRWAHNSSTSEYTYQTVSEKRGVDGMAENGVLPDFNGIAVHDCWRPYWRYDGIEHATCGAHFLREIAGIEDMEPRHRWPDMMRELLLRMKSEKERSQENASNGFSEYILKGFSDEYDAILILADVECPSPPKPTVKHRGRRKKGKERALIERFQSLKPSICMFETNFEVPFDNNQAERDVRNIKTKVKVAGGFRTIGGAQTYLDIMSYLSTCRKHGIDAYKALKSAFEGNALVVIQGF